MEPGGSSAAAPKVQVDPEDFDLNETDSSELSASTACSGTLPHEPTDVEPEEDHKKRRTEKKAREDAKELQRLKEKQ